ncbi:hypothetical protein DID88_006655 [Monilinia fructigena]|uniref:Uncharacterized protein n=1 Tax=Monilinia fructigena TaxID=38457 RepID=A0A395IG46_9HELO|nr:hypothetical protein DID88_006655 [Monilinia fructigena]
MADPSLYKIPSPLAGYEKLSSAANRIVTGWKKYRKPADWNLRVKVMRSLLSLWIVESGVDLMYISIISIRIRSRLSSLENYMRESEENSLSFASTDSGKSLSDPILLRCSK